MSRNERKLQQVYDSIKLTFASRRGVEAPHTPPGRAQQRLLSRLRVTLWCAAVVAGIAVVYWGLVIEVTGVFLAVVT